jgi:uncharacterized protein YjiS (DUF1127 family)
MRAIGATFRRWRERRQRAAAISELRALDDRTLKDMGLTRGEIIATVRGQVDRGGVYDQASPSRLHQTLPVAGHDQCRT